VVHLHNHKTVRYMARQLCFQTQSGSVVIKVFFLLAHLIVNVKQIKHGVEHHQAVKVIKSESHLVIPQTMSVHLYTLEVKRYLL